jgi:hypothetical protein
VAPVVEVFSVQVDHLFHHKEILAVVAVQVLLHGVVAAVVVLVVLVVMEHLLRVVLEVQDNQQHLLAH